MMPNGDDIQRALAAVQVWADRLIDTSRRNPLLYFRETKTTALFIPDQEKVTKLFQGRSLSPSDLEGLPLLKAQTGSRSVEDISSVFRNLQRRALLDREEKGVETLAVGTGFATWESMDGGRNPRAPVVLLPVEIKPTQGTLELQASGDPRINPVLLHVLRNDLNLDIDESELLSRLPALNGNDDGEGKDLQPVFDQLRSTCAKVPGFAIEAGAGLGTFRYQRMAMVSDLLGNQETIAEQGIVQAIAGALGPRREMGTDPSGEPPALDALHPEEEFLVLDADASQRTAIRRVLRGESGVIHGPPGTGKSQTIANLIAECAADGKRVLFVAEKKAAIEAVLKRLDEVGLGHIALDLHSAGLKKKAVAEFLGKALEWIRESRPMDGDSVHGRYTKARDRLIDYTKRIHAPRSDTGESLFGMWSELLGTPERARSGFRLSGHLLDSIDRERAEDAERILDRAASAADLFLRSPDHPWGRSSLASPHEVEGALDLVQRVGSRLPAVARAAEQAGRAMDAPAPETLSEGLGFLSALARFHEIRSNYDEVPSEDELRSLTRDLAPAAKGWGSVFTNWLSSSEFRRARHELRSRRLEKTSTSTILWEARTILDQLIKLRKAGATREASEWTVDMDTDEFLSAKSEVEDLLALLGTTGDEIRLDGVSEWIGRLLELRRDAALVPGARRLEQELAEMGLDGVIQDLKDTPAPPNQWAARLRYVWLHSHLDRIEIREPDVSAFRGRTHDETVAEFQKWDRRRTRLARDRVRREVATRAVASMDKNPDQTSVIRREASRRSRHIPIRRLFEEAGDVLTRIVPCWVASPLTVSELLDSRPERFDLVIFDEGSQIPPEDAVPAIYRGKQLVVAGDPEQLPPTTFFSAEGAAELDEDEYADDLEGFESILDIVLPFLSSFHLRWHYRSEDERLIAFSNHHIYDDGLITLPSANPGERIRLEVVGRRMSGGGQTSSASAEVSRAVELALEHARSRPTETLGIITFGDQHRRRVERALDDALTEASGPVREFFAFDREERAFVKNLETVQGDERDAIILTVGYGWDANGNLPHRFGPLTQEVGYRRLNVAVTRARKRMTIVSSFRSEDVDLNRSGSRGVRLLKEFLTYADSGGDRVSSDPLAAAVPLNPFERDIKLALERSGLNVVGQYGASQYRIDLVAMHPDKPGLPVLAIECDGASYHSSPAARDRDRIRQEQLERLGWRFHRIWSTDWFYRREEEMERAKASYERALDFVNGSGLGITDLSEENGSNRDEEDEWTPEAVEPRGWQKPDIRHYGSITDIPFRKLIILGRAILADGRPRTLDDLVEEMYQETPFGRRGRRIMATLERAAKQARSSMDART